MYEPTQSDLEKLLERMREERERADTASGQVPGPLASNGQSRALRRRRTGSEPGHVRGERPGPVRAAATPPEPEPSKLIFGRDLRNPDSVKDVYVPPQYRVDPKKVHIDSLVIERVGDVPEHPVKWLWPGRIPLGRVTLLAGDPGICKSLVALDIAARVTSGAAWPDAPGESREPAGAIVFSMEDDLCDTIKPRLMRAGADDQRTYVIEGVYNKPPYRDLRVKRRFRIQEDINSLKQALLELRPVRLVVFDPINAYCGSGDGVAMSVVHSMLAPLIDMAAQFEVAILCTTHLRGSSRKAVHSAVGNLSFTTAARAVWGLVPDARDKARRLMVPVKMNLAPDATGLAFRIDPAGKLVWETEPVPLSADEAMQEEREGTKKQDAIGWLHEVLAKGSLPSKLVIAQGREYGFSASTLRRARRLAGVTITLEGFSEKKGSTWSLDVASRDEVDFYGGL